MKIIGFNNIVTKAGNIGVRVCVTGDWSNWDRDNGNTKGEKAEIWYVSGIHLSDEDIGKSVRFILGKSKYDGRPYVRKMLFQNSQVT